MNENERDFQKVLESIKSLERQIIELNIYVREQIKHLLETNKEDTIYQHEVNLSDKEFYDWSDNKYNFYVHTDQIKELKEKIDLK